MLNLLFFFCLLKFLSFSNGANDDDDSGPFNSSEVSLIEGYFLSNIGPSGTYSGCVIASPSNSNPNYYYHWQRDAAISMQTLITTFNSSYFDSRFQNYVKWVEHVQSLTDTNGINILGEPKFNTDGSLFTGGWCRPQNDGPASRALALIIYANWLIDNGRIDYVKSNLFNPGSSLAINDDSCNVADQDKSDCGYYGINEDECESKGCCWEEINPNPNNYPWCYYKGGSSGDNSTGTIPTDLNYVITVWDSTNNCDLWEEVRGIHFYTLMVQHYALLKGAELATRLGDSNLATTWTNTANNMKSTIQGFESNNIIQDDQRTYDCSVILGSLYGGENTTYSLYPPTSTVIINSAQTFSTYFDKDFVVNENDDNIGLGGTLIGRYENDNYNGCASNGGSHGHAWILCSNALADLWYRNSMSIIENINNNNNNNDDFIITPKHLEIYSKIINKTKPISSIKLKQYAQDWENNNLSYQDKKDISLLTASLLTSTGDEQLQRVHYHVASCNVHMSEQICETSGVQIGAIDLTWSYGTFLRAWYSRNLVLNTGVLQLDQLEKAPIQFDFENQKFDYQTCLEGCNGQCSD